MSCLFNGFDTVAELVETSEIFSFNAFLILFALLVEFVLSRFRIISFASSFVSIRICFASSLAFSTICLAFCFKLEVSISNFFFNSSISLEFSIILSFSFAISNLSSYIFLSKSSI